MTRPYCKQPNACVAGRSGPCRVCQPRVCSKETRDKIRASNRRRVYAKGWKHSEDTISKMRDSHTHMTDHARNSAIFYLLDCGKSYAEAGSKFGITKQRIHQIVQCFRKLSQ